jgi:hypothetical protein
MSVLLIFNSDTTATLDNRVATFIAEDLRLAAAGERGDIADPTAARILADEIELRLTGALDTPIDVTELGSGALDALYRNLSVTVTGTTDENLLAIYRAARAWHDAQLSS